MPQCTLLLHHGFDFVVLAHMGLVHDCTQNGEPKEGKEGITTRSHPNQEINGATKGVRKSRQEIGSACVRVLASGNQKGAPLIAYDFPSILCVANITLANEPSPSTPPQVKSSGAIAGLVGVRGVIGILSTDGAVLVELGVITINKKG